MRVLLIVALLLGLINLIWTFEIPELTPEQQAYVNSLLDVDTQGHENVSARKTRQGFGSWDRGYGGWGRGYGGWGRGYGGWGRGGWLGTWQRWGYGGGWGRGHDWNYGGWGR